MSDEIDWTDLLGRIKSGDRNAESQLVNQFWRGVFFVLYKQTGERQLSEDLAQETLVVVLNNAKKGLIQNPAALPSYVRQTGVNILIGLRRKESRQNTHADSDAIDRLEGNSESLIATVEKEQAADCVRQALSELKSDRDRDILHRHYLLGEDKSSSCAALGVTAAHYDRVLHRARQRLKQLLVSKHGTTDERPTLELLGLFLVFSLITTVLKQSEIIVICLGENTDRRHYIEYLHNGHCTNIDDNGIRQLV